MPLRALALAGLLALPSLAAAQAPLPNPMQLPTARFAFTPFVGVQVPYETGNLFFLTPSGVSWVADEQRAGGPLVGGEVQAQVWGPLSVLGSLGYAHSGDTEVTLVSTRGDVRRGEIDGPDLWLARAAVAFRLPDPVPDNRRFHPAGFVVAGPALVRVDHSDVEGLRGGANNHWAFNLGFQAVTSLGSPRVALHVAVDDYVTFWDTDRFVDRDEALFGIILEEPVVVRHDSEVSNLLTLRAGVSLRF